MPQEAAFFYPFGEISGLVHWDKFGIPDYDKPLLQLWFDTWWWDEVKAERVRLGMADLTGR